MAVLFTFRPFFSFFSAFSATFDSERNSYLLTYGVPDTSAYDLCISFRGALVGGRCTRVTGYEPIVISNGVKYGLLAFALIICAVRFL
jgi:hypothetical protein